ncbi:MAG: outer membrane beta-barrel protein, partial [Methylovirgula sp.]
MVLGVETDFDYLGLRASTGGTFTTPVAGPQISSTSASTEWLYTLRPRVGLTLGPALLYATGGLALTEERINETNMFPGVNAGSDIFSAEQARIGWIIGGGAEYRLDNHWSIKAEYLYARFEPINGVSTSNTPYFGVTTPISYSHRLELNTQI